MTKSPSAGDPVNKRLVKINNLWLEELGRRVPRALHAVEIHVLPGLFQDVRQLRALTEWDDIVR